MNRLLEKMEKSGDIEPFCHTGSLTLTSQGQLAANGALYRRHQNANLLSGNSQLQLPKRSGKDGPKYVFFYDNDIGNIEDSSLCPFVRFCWVKATGNFWSDTLFSKNVCNFKRYDQACLQLFQPGSPARHIAEHVLLMYQDLSYDHVVGKKVSLPCRVQQSQIMERLLTKVFLGVLKHWGFRQETEGGIMEGVYYSRCKFRTLSKLFARRKFGSILTFQ